MTQREQTTARPRELEPFVWFSQQVEAAVAGKSLDAALDDLGKLIEQATVDKEFGYGPPVDEINRARRRWNDLYEIWTEHPERKVA